MYQHLNTGRQLKLELSKMLHPQWNIKMCACLPPLWKSREPLWLINMNGFEWICIIPWSTVAGVYSFGIADCLFHNLQNPYVHVLWKIIKLWQIYTSSDAKTECEIILPSALARQNLLEDIHQRQWITCCSLFHLPTLSTSCSTSVVANEGNT